MLEFEEKVEQWAYDRNLIAGSTPKDQLKKLKEELTELEEAIENDDQDEIEDGIGDMSVVLQIIAVMCHTDLTICQARAWDEIKDRKGKLIDGVFVKEEDLPEGLSIEEGDENDD